MSILHVVSVSGGKHVDWIRVMEEPKECSSAYNLCE